MKTIPRIICFIALGVSLLACTKDAIRASHEITTRDHSFSGYSALDVSDNFNVYITFSETEEKISVEANDNLHEHIGLQMEGNKLMIKLKDLRNIRGKETLNVFITTKSITDFKAAGNSNLTLENSLNAPKVKLDIAGNSWFTGSLITDGFELKATGNCNIDLEGSAKRLDANLKGNCEFSDYNLVVEALTIDLSGNSNAYLTITDSIDIDAKGNSVLSYKGDARVTHQDLSSDSQIIKK